MLMRKRWNRKEMGNYKSTKKRRKEAFGDDNKICIKLIINYN